MYKTKLLGILTGLLLLGSLSGCKEKLSADRIVYGSIWTANPDNPWAEAMAIKGDSILAVGTVSEMEPYKGVETMTTELQKSNMVVPGFIDSHTHFVDGGLELSSVQL